MGLFEFNQPPFSRSLGQLQHINQSLGADLATTMAGIGHLIESGGAPVRIVTRAN